MAKTGYLVIIYQDINPSSPTYNQTREERTQDEENCPTSAEAHWIEDTKYCELTENGMLTGYEITVYRDVEPLSSTYNQTREERELNLEECEADSSLPNWQNIGEPFCRQTVYMPGGLMGNDGYMVQQQQDMNEYSETADEIRDVETLDLENCPLPNTEPVWQIISESCHLVTYNGQLVYDGTKDVIRVNTNQYSSTWNNNIPETVNVEDEINCPSGIETQYRWVIVSGEYICVGFDKHAMEKKQQSTDGGQTWEDVVPLETKQGDLIEANSEDCGYVPPTPGGYENQYLTFVASENGTFTFTPERSNVISYSTDNGNTWTEGNSVSVNNGDKVMWKGTASPTYFGIGAFSATGNFDIQGNPMSLLFGDNFKGQTDLTGKNYALSRLFSNNSKVINAENLSLPATTLTVDCYSMMFYACTSLTTAPALPATTLATYCYQGMFQFCRSLRTAPELPATTLASSCYYNMFYDCSRLGAAPQLPATTLADYCYARMFYHCIALKASPFLPATTLADYCYQEMFQSCEGLEFIKCLATDMSATDCLTNWVNGVASSGTFVKNSAATWTTGNNGIPSGWTVETASA